MYVGAFASMCARRLWNLLFGAMKVKFLKAQANSNMRITPICYLIHIFENVACK